MKVTWQPEIDRQKHQEDDPVQWIYSDETLSQIRSQPCWMAQIDAMNPKDNEAAQDKKEIHAAIAEKKNAMEQIVIKKGSTD